MPEPRVAPTPERSGAREVERYVDIVARKNTALADVPTGGSATVTDNATKINDILQLLRDRGLLAP